jgi:hypothetical protein
MKDLPANSPDRNGGMFGAAGYGNTLSRWYNPWTTQQVTDPTEKAMMRVGQGGLGVGALATAAAGGVAAGAPVLASTPLTHLPAYFAGGGGAAAAGAGGAGAAGAAAANPTVRQMFPTFTNMASNTLQTAGNALQFGSNVAGRINDTSRELAARAQGLKADAFQNLPDNVRKGLETYEHHIGAPIDRAAERLGANQIGNPLNGLTQLVGGNPMGAVPHGYSVPIEGAKMLAETGEHFLGEQGGELAHAGMH